MGNRWARLALGIWSVGLGACATAGAGNAPPAREATAAGPALPAHVERAHRRVLERCLALPVAGVDGATLEFPPSMLDGVDETAAPRSAEQLRREIAHLDATLEAAGASGERASALYQSARLWAELARGLDGEAAAAAQRESLTRYQQVLEDGAGRVLTPLAQLAVGRLQLALGDVASARAAFLAIGRNEPPHLSAAAAANLERLAELEGDREAALAVRAEAPRAEQERRSWRRTVSTLNALLHYRQAWLLRLGGDEAGALAAFDRVDDVVARDNPHLAWIEERTQREICAPWRGVTVGGEAPSLEALAQAVPPDATANVRLLHVAAARQAASVALAVEGAAEPLVDEVTAGEEVSYVPVPIGSMNLVVRSADGTNLASLAAAFAPYHAYTVILRDGARPRDPLVAEVQEDVFVDTISTHITIRFSNVMQGAPELELCRADTRGATTSRVFSGAAFGTYGIPQFGEGAAPVDGMTNAVEIVAHGEVDLVVRVASRTPCEGRVLGTARFRADSGLNGTILAMGGFRARSGRQLLMCADAPSDTSCIVVALDGR